MIPKYDITKFRFIPINYSKQTTITITNDSNMDCYWAAVWDRELDEDEINRIYYLHTGRFDNFVGYSFNVKIKDKDEFFSYCSTRQESVNW